ncbi:hypothetical protein FKB34_13800 [Glycocaulis profundi]|nr:hypothetical protein FKB34_13800 [Glycocaulis profundi]
MDVTATPSQPQAGKAVRLPSETFSPEAGERMRHLAGIVLDESVNYGLDEQVRAFQSLWSMAANAELRGMGSEDADLYNKARSHSAIAVRGQQLGQQYGAVISNASARGEHSGDYVGEAGRAFFDRLSDDDQLLFFMVQNTPTSNGATRFNSFQEFDDTLAAQARYDSYVRDAKANGVTAQNDPTFAAAMKLTTDAPADWDRQVLLLLGDPRAGANRVASDRVDLSPQAQALLDRQAATTSEAAAAITSALKRRHESA